MLTGYFLGRLYKLGVVTVDIFLQVSSCFFTQSFDPFLVLLQFSARNAIQSQRTDICHRRKDEYKVAGMSDLTQLNPHLFSDERSLPELTCFWLKVLNFKGILSHRSPRIHSSHM